MDNPRDDTADECDDTHDTFVMTTRCADTVTRDLEVELFMTLQQKRAMMQRFAALALGLFVFGTPLVSFGQTMPAPPPPPPQLEQLPPPPIPQPPPPPAGTNLQAPPPPPPGAQPYPYPPYPPYPPPYAQPGQQPNGWYGNPALPAQGIPPETLPFNENEPIPPGYKVEEHMRRGLVIAGGVVFGVFYVGSAMIGAQSISYDEAPYGAMFVPVLGPFIVGAAGDFGDSSTSGNFVSAVATGSFVLMGLGQAAGAAMLLSGIFAKKKVLVRQDVAHVMRPDVFIGPGSIGMKLAF
jgi:hypothetical protein